MSTVLVAEDDGTLRELLTAALETAGYEVAALPDGESALRSALDRRPDAAVLDVAMPGMTGLDLCRSLRNDERTAELPVILLNARSQWIDVASGFDAGADDYVVKPFSPRDLVHRLGALLGR